MTHHIRHIALTGNIGCGKSSVAAWLRQRGARVFDADAVAHIILETQEAVFEARRLWGEACLKTDKSGIDKARIARIIFNDADARRVWESFIHLRIDDRLKEWQENVREEWVKSGQKNAMFVYDIPLFFEKDWGRDRSLDEIWVVSASRETCRERLMQDRGMDPRDIQMRLAAQMPIEKKAEQADVVIDNSGPWEDTVEQLEVLWNKKGSRM